MAAGWAGRAGANGRRAPGRGSRLGGPYTSGAADIGTAVIYAVMFAGPLALSYYAGPARYSADYYLEQKISR